VALSIRGADPGQSPPSEDVMMEVMAFRFSREMPNSCHQPSSIKLVIQQSAVCTRRHPLSIRAPVGALNVADRRYGIVGALRCSAMDINHRYLWCCSCTSRTLCRGVGSTYDAVTAETSRHSSNDPVNAG